MSLALTNEQRIRREVINPSPGWPTNLHPVYVMVNTLIRRAGGTNRRHKDMQAWTRFGREISRRE